MLDAERAAAWRDGQLDPSALLAFELQHREAPVAGDIAHREQPLRAVALLAEVEMASHLLGHLDEGCGLG
ncbi:MAG: hypothetical protein ACRDVP_10195 [Acidimicrobiales bacterium]